MADESHLLTLITCNVQGTRPFKLLECKSVKPCVSDYCYGYIHVLSPSPPTDLAEYVLNKCITQAEPKRQISIDGEEHMDTIGSFVGNDPTVTADQSVHYNFDYLEDSNGQLNHVNKPELHIDGGDSMERTTVIGNQPGHEHLENSDEQISHEHHEKYINELEPKQQIGVDGEDDVDGPVTAEKPDHYNTAEKPDDYHTAEKPDHYHTAEKPDHYNTAEKPDDYNFGDQDDKDRQILRNDHSNHILDWMVS